MAKAILFFIPAVHRAEVLPLPAGRHGVKYPIFWKLIKIWYLSYQIFRKSANLFRARPPLNAMFFGVQCLISKGDSGGLRNTCSPRDFWQLVIDYSILNIWLLVLSFANIYLCVHDSWPAGQDGSWTILQFYNFFNFFFYQWPPAVRQVCAHHFNHFPRNKSGNFSAGFQIEIMG